MFTFHIFLNTLFKCFYFFFSILSDRKINKTIYKKYLKNGK